MKIIDISSVSKLSVIGHICENPASRNWTISSLLGCLLTEAELIYGPRENNIIPLGVEYVSDGPIIFHSSNPNHVTVNLSLKAAYDISIAIYQLAHEVVHLLAPRVHAAALTIEEGVATHFSNEVSKKWSLNMSTKNPKYDRASRLYNDLEAIYPGSVKMLRAKRTSFHDFDAKFVEAETGCGSQLAAELCKPF